MPEKFVKLLKGIEALQFFDRAARRSTKKQRSKRFEKRGPVRLSLA
jgi:hypothetical protein